MLFLHVDYKAEAELQLTLCSVLFSCCSVLTLMYYWLLLRYTMKYRWDVCCGWSHTVGATLTFRLFWPSCRLTLKPFTLGFRKKKYIYSNYVTLHVVGSNVKIWCQIPSPPSQHKIWNEILISEEARKFKFPVWVYTNTSLGHSLPEFKLAVLPGSRKW